MGKHMKSESSSPRHGYNHKSGWLAGMLHVFDFHRWRAKNRPICWKTPRTHSLVYEANEQEPFLDSNNRDSKIVSAEKPTRQLKKMMTTKQVAEYVDFLEILRKEDVSVKILKDPNSEFRKQVHIKSSPRVLPKSGSFPLSRSSRPARIEHKLKENWYAPKQKDTVLTLTVQSESSQENKPTSPSHHGSADDHGFNHAVINGFREIKKMLKKALGDRKHTKKDKKYSAVSRDDSVGRYYQLLEQSFGRKGGDLRSKSLKLSYEEKRSQLRDDNKPQFFRRVSSLSSLEVLGSFLTEPARDSSSRKSVDLDSNLESKKSISLTESPAITENQLEKEEEQEERRQENQVDCVSQSTLQQEQDSVPISSLDKTAQRTESLLSQGLGLSSHESYNHEDVYFCYVKTVLKLSGFLENVHNVEKWHSEEQPLNPSLLYQVEMQEEKEVNKELLFDLVNEAIIETRNQSHIYFPKTFSFAYPHEKRFLDEVWGRVEWTLSGLGAENRDRSLDDIVGRDLTKRDGWMNLRGETEWFTLELEDLIFDEVLDEMICVY